MTDSDDKHAKPVFNEKDSLMADLNNRRTEAMHKGQYLDYAILNEFLGIIPEDIDKHNQGLEERKSNVDRAETLEEELKIKLYGEEYVKQKIKPPVTIRENNYTNFGIRTATLNALPYHTVREIFFGVNNFDCPELYRYMNPTEVLGLWTGIDRKDVASIQNINTDSALHAISALVSKGYESSIEAPKTGNEVNFAILSQTLNKKIDIYRTASGDLKERLTYVDEDTMQKAVQQLCLPRRFTEKDRYTERGFTDKNTIYDPMSDVTRPTVAGKKIYIDNIMDIISNSYRNSIVDKL